MTNSKWPHPGTRKDWGLQRRYRGVLRSDMGEEFWECSHFHKTAHEALDCAWEYRNSQTWDPLKTASQAVKEGQVSEQDAEGQRWDEWCLNAYRVFVRERYNPKTQKSELQYLKADYLNALEADLKAAQERIEKLETLRVEEVALELKKARLRPDQFKYPNC